MKKVFKSIGMVVMLMLIAGVIFLNTSPQFGGSPDAKSQAKIAQSDNHNGDIFVNQRPIKMVTRDTSDASFVEDVLAIAVPNANKNPTEPLPSKAINGESLKEGSFIWLGHSTVLFKTAGKVIMTDPVFHSAAPISFAVKPFAMQHTPTIESLPAIDAVLISHDHYDHLDYNAIKKMADKVAHFYVPLGIKGHLQRWDVPDDKITELDWYEKARLGDIDLVLTPSQHFSGRGVFDRFSTLWSSWVVKSPALSVYFSGDGGYSSEFAIIGEKFGPFDIAFMEDGAYNPGWADIHMTPEQAVQAAVDLRAQVLLPIHWAKFDLSLHEWRDPIERISKASQNKPIRLATPIIGDTFTLDNVPQTHWWKDVK